MNKSLQVFNLSVLHRPSNRSYWVCLNKHIPWYSCFYSFRKVRVSYCVNRSNITICVRLNRPYCRSWNTVRVLLTNFSFLGNNVVKTQNGSYLPSTTVNLLLWLCTTQKVTWNGCWQNYQTTKQTRTKQCSLLIYWNLSQHKHPQQSQ